MCPGYTQTDRQTDGQKAMHMSQPCISTGGLKYTVFGRVCLSHSSIIHVMISGRQHSFPSSNFILIPPSNLHFIAQSRFERLIYPNPEHEFKFYPNSDKNLFFPSPEIEFYPIIPTKNKFYPFIQRLRRQQKLVTVCTVLFIFQFLAVLNLASLELH